MAMRQGNPEIRLDGSEKYADGDGRLFLSVFAASLQYNVKPQAIRYQLRTEALEPSHVAHGGINLYPAEKMEEICTRIRNRVFIDDAKARLTAKKQAEQSAPHRGHLNTFDALAKEIDRLRRDQDARWATLTKWMASVDEQIGTIVEAITK